MRQCRRVSRRSSALQVLPDAVLPAQLLSRRPHQVQPERRLMIAVLDDAVWCFRKFRLATRPWQRRLFRETCDWLAAEPNGNLFSFVSICEALGFDPASVRRSLWES